MSANCIPEGRVTLELPNDVTWSRYYSESGNCEYERRDERGSIDYDFSLSMVERFLADTQLFTEPEALLIRALSGRQLAETVADILEKRASPQPEDGAR